jgi:transposase
VELFEEIRREYEHGVGSIRGIARKLGVHRRMVREAIVNAVPGERKRPVREKPKLMPAVDFIEAILESDRKAPRKQRHTAHRIWCRLQVERPELEIAESTIRRYVRQRKRQLGQLRRDVCIPQSYAWGQEGQVDWYDAVAEMDGEQTKVHVFCLRSMASAAAFHRAYLHANQQAFLEAHELGFQYFGGVFQVLRYDNLRSAVKKILRGHRREETARFIAFRSHWGFQSEFCTPDEGHEKGGVEGENGYFRRNHLVPLPKVRSLEELNEWLTQSAHEDGQRIVGERTQTVGAGMNLEREHLLPLAKEGFDLAGIHFPQVNGSGCVRVLTNFYSVPLPVGTGVEAKVYASYVEIWHEGKCVARHERCYSRRQKVLDLEHYLEALIRKPGALAGSTPLAQWRAQGRWPANYDRFWDALKQRQGKQEGTRAMIEILQLGSKHGYLQLQQAVEEALDLGCFDVGAIRLLLEGAKLQPQKLAETVQIGELRSYDRPQPSLTDYDELLRNWQPAKGVLQ